MKNILYNGKQIKKEDFLLKIKSFYPDFVIDKQTILYLNNFLHNGNNCFSYKDIDNVILNINLARKRNLKIQQIRRQKEKKVKIKVIEIKEITKSCVDLLKSFNEEQLSKIAQALPTSVFILKSLQRGTYEAPVHIYEKIEYLLYNNKLDF